MLLAHSESSLEVCIQLWIKYVDNLDNTWIRKNMKEYKKQGFGQMVKETALLGIEKIGHSLSTSLYNSGKG